jgi:hypothetical protein
MREINKYDVPKLREGMHGKAKTQHGLRRAVRRGLSNVAIQVYLTAAVINLKRLAAVVIVFFTQLFFYFWKLWNRRKPDIVIRKISFNLQR